jgi:hypothetical protein
MGGAGDASIEPQMVATIELTPAPDQTYQVIGLGWVTQKRYFS